MMDTWARGLGAAITVCLSLFFWSITLLYEFVIGPFSVMGVVILVFVGLFFFGLGVFLYRKLFLSMGLREAFVRLSIWLALLVVVIPNALMSLILMGIHVGFAFALFAISASVYYAIPAQFADEGVFLMETVIAPNGAEGIFISALFWIAVLVVILIALNTTVMILNRKRSQR
jgi:hypothetical protein